MPSSSKGQFVYTGIRVKDMNQSIRFYTRLLGLRLRGRGRNRSIAGAWAQLESPGTHQVLELNYYSRRSPLYSRWRRGSELDHLCFRVVDVDKAVAHLEAAGAKKLGGPYLTPGWKMVDVTDPNGICIEVGSPVRPRPNRRD